MKIFLKLLALNIKVNFGLSALRDFFRTRSKTRALPQAILITLAIALGGGSFIVMYSFIADNIFKAGNMLGQPEIVLTLAFLVCQMIMIFFGIFYMMSAFYFSNDIQFLVPLPLKPYQVLGSKFLIVMLFEYFTAIPVMLPPVIIYGIRTGIGVGAGVIVGTGSGMALDAAPGVAAEAVAGLGAGAGMVAGVAVAALYWIKSLLMIIALPVLPLVLASLMVILLMRFANLRRHKDLLAVIGSFVAIFFAMGINLMTAKVPVGNEQDFFVNMLQSRMGLINWIGSKFPPSIWATLGISDAGLRGAGYLGLYIGVSILLFIALMLLGNALFYKSVLAGQEVSRKRKALVLGPSGRNNGISGLVGGINKTGRSPVQAICGREWKLLVRTPIYLINGMSGVIIGPMMILFMMMSQGKSGSNGEFEELYKIIQNPAMQLQAILVGLAFVVFSAGMNLVASTSISREGNTCWISKIIPVSPAEQMAGKLKHSMQVCLLSILATTSILFFYLKFDPGRIAAIIGISVIASLFLQALGLIIDLARPKLVWNNPQEAIKQNMNGFLGMIAAFAVIGAGALVSISMIKADAPEWSVYLVLGGIMAVLAITGVWMLFKKADRLFARIEV